LARWRSAVGLPEDLFDSLQRSIACRSQIEAVAAGNTPNLLKGPVVFAMTVDVVARTTRIWQKETGNRVATAYCIVSIICCGRAGAAGARRHATRAIIGLLFIVTSPLATLMDCTSSNKKFLMIAQGSAGNR